MFRNHLRLFRGPARGRRTTIMVVFGFALLIVAVSPPATRAADSSKTQQTQTTEKGSLAKPVFHASQALKDYKAGEIIRDVKLLRLLSDPRYRDSPAIPFDVEATILLCDKFRSVRFVHKGIRLIGAMPADGLETIPPFGSLVRIRGVTQPGMLAFQIHEMEVTGKGQIPNPKTDAWMPGHYCEVQGMVTEVSSVGLHHQMRIRNQDGVHLWTINAKLPIELIWDAPMRLVSATGVMMADSPTNQHSQVVAMDPSQFTFLLMSSKQKHVDEIEGIVLATDLRNFVAVSDGETVRWLRTLLPFRVKAGDRVKCLYAELEDSTGDPTGSLRVLRLVGRSELPDPKTMEPHELVDTKQTLNQVSVTGTVRSISTLPDVLEVRLLEGSTRFATRIKRKGLSPELENLKVGDVVRLAGIRRSFGIEASENFDFRIALTAPNSVAIIERSYSLYSKQLGMVAIATLCVLGGLAVWIVMMRTLVRRRTRDVQALASRLQASCDAICEGILFFNSKGNLIQSTGIAANLVTDFSNVQPNQTKIRQRMAQTVKDSDGFCTFWDQSFSDDKVMPRQDFSTTDGSKTFSLYSVPIAGDHDSGGRVMTVEDVTKQRTMEMEIVQSQKMHAVGQLAGGIAHDFNNLLMAISANLALSELSASDPAAVQKHVSIASDAVDRAATLTQQLLGFSRQSALSFEVAHVNDVVSRVGELTRPVLNAQVTLTQTMAVDLWHTVMDSEQIERVLMNLVLNASDSLKGKVGQINVGTQNSVHAEIGDCVSIIVSDDGCGMSQEIMQRVFEPFFTTKDVGQGTGLGLAMAFGIVRQHGGKIECESKLGEGSSFTVFLPRTKEQPALNGATATGATATGTTVRSAQDHEVSPTQRRRVLLVDDEKAIQQAASSLLNAIGHPAVCADNGKQALKELEKDSDFGLVLLDLTMPVMDGRETLQHIKQLYPKLPVVVCSGYSADAQLLLDDETLAPEGFIAKPFRLNELRRVIDASCSNDQQPQNHAAQHQSAS